MALGRFHEGVYQFVGGTLLSLYQLFDSIGAMFMGKDKAGKTLTRKEYEKELKKVHAEIVNLQDRILEFPDSGRPFGRRLRRARVRGFPYGLLYRVEPSRILIVAVAHLHRRPGYWRSRL